MRTHMKLDSRSKVGPTAEQGKGNVDACGCKITSAKLNFFQPRGRGHLMNAYFENFELSSEELISVELEL